MGLDKLTYHQYDVIEHRFLLAVMEMIQTRPFWWHLFINKVLGSPLITYFKDTTMIISLNDLPYHQIEITFEIIRQLLKIRAATKVIKKKEFIIVHLYSQVIMDYLSLPNKWILIPFYFFITRNYPKFQCFFGVKYQNETESAYIDLLMLHDKKTYWVTIDKPSEISYQGVKKLQIVLGEHARIKPEMHYDIFRISFDTQGMIEVLNSYFQSLATNQKICYN